MQFPSRIRLFSAPVNWPQLIRETYSECFHKKKNKREKFSNEFSKIKILNLKEWRKEGGRNAWKVEKLEIERYYSTSKNVIYIYDGVESDFSRSWLGRISPSLSLCLGTVFSYADLGRARERKRERGCLSAICKWRRIAVSGRFDNGPDNYARYNGLAFTPRVRSIVKVSWPMNRGENSVAPYRRPHDIFNYRDTFLSRARPSVGTSGSNVQLGKIRFRIARRIVRDETCTQIKRNIETRWNFNFATSIFNLITSFV